MNFQSFFWTHSPKFSLLYHIIMEHTVCTHAGSHVHIGIVAPVSNGRLTMRTKQSISAGNAILTNVMPFKLWTVLREHCSGKNPGYQ